MKNHDKFPKFLGYIFPIAAFVILVVLIAQICFLKETNWIVYVSELGVTIAFDFGGFALNIHYIRKAEKMNIGKVNSLKVKQNNSIHMENVRNANIEEAVIKTTQNPDKEVIEMLSDHFHEFEKSVNDGSFSLEGSFALDLLTPLIELKSELSTSSAICKNKELEGKIKLFSNNLVLFLDGVNFHSFGIETNGYNKMRWIDMEEEIGYGEFSEHSADKINQEKKAYQETEEALSKCIAIYSEIIAIYKNM